MNQEEHKEQKALIKWAGLQSKTIPALKLLFAIPNGGARHIAVATKLKAEGVRRGVPDLMLPVANGTFHGLFIEMKKVNGGRASKEQIEWQTALQLEGYQSLICEGWLDAKESIEIYLGWG